MEVVLTDTIDPRKLTVVLIARETLEGTKEQLPTLPSDLDLDLTDCEKDKDYRYLTLDHRWYFWGIGAEHEFCAEDLRKIIAKAVAETNKLKAHNLQIVFHGFADHRESRTMAIALGEMPILANYQFLVQKSKDLDKLKNTLHSVYIKSDINDLARYVEQGKKVATATCHARDMVNEPPNVINSTGLAQRAKDLGTAAGLSVEVLGKTQIESLKMGGLLAVNRGSIDEPTFTIIEHKPSSARNSKPYVLVGKGVVFDTGGLSLKPTAGSMDAMKSDMAGAAAVIGTMLALAYNETPVHVVGLIPATDNRPGQNAYTPNDVVTMMSGLTVEVLNTDAEGRMILADALHFAKRYEPELVVDLATLTGAAVIGVGHHATALMSNDRDTVKKEELMAAGFRTFERLVELPLWAEYGEQLKSDVADIKNIGGRSAGSITAGKFLEHFTDYPWIHLDIAGTAYQDKPVGWQPKNGTGVGVRMLHEFFSTL